MASKKFIFGAQPALDKAISEQEDCEQAVVDARKALAREQQLLKELHEALEKIRQQIKEMHDNLVSPERIGQSSDPRELMRMSQSIDVQKDREQKQKEKIVAQKERVSWAADKVELRKRELLEATAHVQALEKLKENRRVEHAAELAKSEESKRDDDAIQLWNTQRKK